MKTKWGYGFVMVGFFVIAACSDDNKAPAEPQRTEGAALGSSCFVACWQEEQRCIGVDPLVPLDPKVAASTPVPKECVDKYSMLLKLEY